MTALAVRVRAVLLGKAYILGKCKLFGQNHTYQSILLAVSFVSCALITFVPRSGQRSCSTCSTFLLNTSSFLASFPVPRPAFRRLQYGKAGRAWYIFSREHDVIDKWQNFQNEDATFCVLFNHLHVQRSVSMTVAPR